MTVNRAITIPTPITIFAALLYLVVKNRIAPSMTITKPNGIANDRGMILSFRQIHQQFAILRPAFVKKLSANCTNILVLLIIQLS